MSKQDGVMAIGHCRCDICFESVDEKGRERQN